MALWSGRFQADISDDAVEFGASIDEDMVMAAQDIAGSIAHAKMLANTGVISPEDGDDIVGGLKDIAQSVDAGAFAYSPADEDVHMAVERTLTEAVGSPGARLHTGRSRNDQVACDLRLWAKDALGALLAGNIALRKAVLGSALAHQQAILPGCTHLQHAQPVRFAHHMLAYCWMFKRDFTRLQAALSAADANPLGAAALAGTTYPIDRAMTTDLLGFDHAIPNSMDAVSDRDFLMDLEYACSMAMMHLSRLCEEIVLWSTPEFGYIELSDAYSTGSSIMPQKKNPDFAELVRGKCGRVVGDLVGMMVTMKSLPLAYNKDLQECKRPAFDAAETLIACMDVVAGMVSTMQVNEARMREQAGVGFTAATDVADYLAKKGMPFRQAHEVCGHLVALCVKRNCNLEDLTLADLQAESDLFESDIMGALDIPAIVAARESYGGTGDRALAVQIDEVRASLTEDEASLA